MADTPLDPGIGILTGYLRNLLPLVLDAHAADLDSSLFLSPHVPDKLAQFASDSLQVVYINKLASQDPDAESAIQYTLTTNITWAHNQVATLALIKRNPTLDLSQPLSSQIIFTNLFGPAKSAQSHAESHSSHNPYESLHSILHLAITPYFDAFVAHKSLAANVDKDHKSADSDSKLGLPAAKKRFTELELSLLHLQQNVDVPEIRLAVHSAIKHAVDQSVEQSVRLGPELLPSTLVTESAFLNRLQADVNSWIKEIQNVTKLNREVSSGTASQEINFWISMEKALEDIEAQLRSDPIVLTLDVLRHAKRFHATVSFLADTGLKEAMDKVHKYNLLMKDFPLDDLLSAVDIDKIQGAIIAIFGHINKKLKLSPYPIRRALPLVEAISRDLNDVTARVLASNRLMYMDFTTFESVMRSVTSLFQSWDDMIKEFTNVAREVTRKRNEKFLPIKISPLHQSLRERCNYLSTFRTQHQQLALMVSPSRQVKSVSSNAQVNGAVDTPSLALMDVNMADEVHAAYDVVKSVDPVDISKVGTEIWIAAETAYNERVARVENQIIARLRDRLGAAKNATEMFRVFSHFNALFVRPKIRGAIQEYQAVLINSVKTDIYNLRETFRLQYVGSNAYRMAQLRDVPPVAGAIIWARQIERQLNAHMKRVEDVLGKGWELYADGAKLQSESQSFRNKLNTRFIYEAWIQDTQKSNLQIAGRLLEISKSRTNVNDLQLSVNFDPQIIVLFKEVRNLIWLNYQIPHTIGSVAKDAKRIYPHAVALMEAVQTYNQISEKLEANSEASNLVAEQHSTVQSLITKGLSFKWEWFVNSFEARQLSYGSGVNSDARETFVQELAAAVSSLQTQSDSAIDIQEHVSTLLDDLTGCKYLATEFSQILSSLQSISNKVSLEGFANFDNWLDALNNKIKQILGQRLHDVITLWSDFLDDDSVNMRTAFSELSIKWEVPVLKHELHMKEHTISVQPPLAHSRSTLYVQLQTWYSVVCNLSIIRGNQTNTVTADDQQTYGSQLLQQLPSDLVRPYTAIEAKISRVTQYVDRWLKFQSLWDLDAAVVYESLGDSLAKWQDLLHGIRKTRATFDNSDTQRSFGPIAIHYDQVQTKINARYDQWQREITSRYGAMTILANKDIYSAMIRARQNLEQLTVEGASTSQAVALISCIGDTKQKTEMWKSEIDLLASGQKLLERQRYHFPEDWMFVDQIESEWNVLINVMQRKDAAIQGQLDSFRAKVEQQDATLSDQVTEILVDWEANRPIQGSVSAEAAKEVLSTYDQRFSALQSNLEALARAKQALSMPFETDDRLKLTREELSNLQSVWAALANIWDQISELQDIPWITVQPRKLRQQLENLVNSARNVPARMRQYAAFEYVQDTLREYLKSIPLINDLRSEAMRERHWRQLFRDIKSNQTYSATSATLGSIWSLDFKRNAALVKNIVIQAQGELALEEFLKQVRESWSLYNLELVTYQNKTNLIRGWDDIFSLCTEHLNSLAAMKHSPYYKEFDEEAASWTDRLNRVHLLFDTWIDVQRQWVYLEGIFSGSADIKHLLPVESARFNNINSEFFATMRKVTKSPFILEVVALPGIQKTLERLADLLAKIQKALGEYLERERSTFPRFYFVGDEDLLEIIGNSQDIHRIAKHLKKMFAGLSALAIRADTTEVHGMMAADGEEVAFKTPIAIDKSTKITDWLKMLESAMKISLASQLAPAYTQLENLLESNTFADDMKSWLEAYPAQLVVLAAQICWSQNVETAISQKSLDQSLQRVSTMLDVLTTAVVLPLSVLTRTKCEHLITECVHQRDVIREIMAANVSSKDDIRWLQHLRFYLDTTVDDPLESLSVHIAGARFAYGFEYLGISDRLVQTPLTDRCYLALTQGLHRRLGGSPFGPAGTGKTETVKALGAHLGRFVLVFCCDEGFDFQAMGRIFVGLCQVGAWGCFDEFNRLEERMMSAVSQQIQGIQSGLKLLLQQSEAEVELVGRRVKLHADTGIFITMNPGYAGRSNLPDNLKKLFRSVAMTRPDRQLIAQVMLISQGFKSAESIAARIVPFFDACFGQLTKQPHYDFGLRALKAVLASSGLLKRSLDQPADANVEVIEQELLVQSIHETIVPKLVAADKDLTISLLAEAFPNIDYHPANTQDLQAHLQAACDTQHLILSAQWMEKCLQLYQIQNIQHGIMLVGPSGCGKTSTWRTLATAMEMWTATESVCHVINPKALSKEALYGKLDSTTRDWTDGLFTMILRKIIDNMRGESNKRHWIVFDGDVDPEWVENLNSVLDDNKMLTLPNGERLALPPNVRLLFEVDTLKHATLATVSRCGMIWFHHENVKATMLCQNYIRSIQNYTSSDDEFSLRTSDLVLQQESRKTLAEIIGGLLVDDGIVIKALDYAASLHHIMDFTIDRALAALFSLLDSTIRDILAYNLQHPDFPLTKTQMDTFVERKLIVSIVWAFCGDGKHDARMALSKFILTQTGHEIPALHSLIDFNVTLPSGDWQAWQDLVPSIDIETHSVTSADVVIPTLDTIRHEDVIYSWVSQRKPLILCGPPGSGKTMTLFAAIRKLQDVEVVGLNFSSATTPELVMKTLDQHCEYRKTSSGTTLAPINSGKWLVIFCDEINLPANDLYGTQRVISFIRQLVEHNGFWRASDNTWITLERTQFVGACNPPTDAGRIPLSHRFLRHAPLIMVDYPGTTSLTQIYGTFNRALLKTIPTLRSFSEALTAAMVEVYQKSQEKFTAAIQAHYVYSPRELTRWMRGIYESIKPLESINVEELVRIWAHEGLRLFSDRLVEHDERAWTDSLIDSAANSHFPNIDRQAALSRPILFSNWTSRNYISVEQEGLRDYARARLKVFHEEEMDVELVLFDDVLDHILRIDRVFRQIQGHMLLIGVSGSGKTTLSRFVAWMNGLSVFQLKAHNKYTAEDFDDDLRQLLRRAGCKGEKICFIMDESNVLESAFLERMNTLLANAEIPGLFEADEYNSLIAACRDGAQRDGHVLDTPEELYRWFNGQIARNLHIVFTMNPPKHGFGARVATSPALFNRCVVDWFGDWSNRSLYQVGMELTHSLDLTQSMYTPPQKFPYVYENLSTLSYHNAIVNAFLFVHIQSKKAMDSYNQRKKSHNIISPRHFLDCIQQFTALFTEKRDDLEEQQRHLNTGLAKLHDTFQQVEELQATLAVTKTQLDDKNFQANEKLQKMVAQQQEAEQQKAASLQIQAALSKQDIAIEERRSIVMADLEKAAPAVEDAQAAVSNIKRQHLTEVRSMANPPEAVKMAMESVCTLLGHKIDSWKTVQSIIRRDDFIASIVNFETANLPTVLRNRIITEYLERPTYNFEAVNRASKACGPLVQWVIAQVGFSDILEKVGPLRQEVNDLEAQAHTTRQQAIAIESMIKELGESIALYKEEYASLIAEVQKIKQQMESVQVRVGRSTKLLDSLQSEQRRWDTGRQTFNQQSTSIAGDTLICAAFLAYSGIFDQNQRHDLWLLIMQHLEASGIETRSELSLIEFLSTADDRAQWHSHGLPEDDLCVENSIILHRFNRYPLIIDPAGQATIFLLKQFANKKLVTTSFLDSAFLKTIESALRFGTPLLIQDVEHMDPILNPILNRELRRTGGRTLVRLGSQDIDFSPAFTMILCTRDPSVGFSPDVCSRVTFANFTMTRSSLQAQALSTILKSERPDIEEKRNDLVKLQGEFRIRLRHLEKDLLKVLNAASGSILDDDKVVESLEHLKKEALEVQAKAEQTDKFMEQVTTVTQIYSQLSHACGSIYFLLDQLASIHHFYQFSLQYFDQIFKSVLLHNTHLDKESEPAARLKIIENDLFRTVYIRTMSSLLQKDQQAFALKLASLKATPAELDYLDHLFNHHDLKHSTVASRLPWLDVAAERLLAALANLPEMPKILEEMQSDPISWKECLAAENPVSGLKHLLKHPSAVIQTLQHLVVVAATRPDRLSYVVSDYLQQAFHIDVQTSPAEELVTAVNSQTSPQTPIALCSVPGYDASYLIDNLATSTSRTCISVAMGSIEGIALAEQAISTSAKRGEWVLLKNVHLASGWLSQLEKQIHGLQSHPNFRLFLTMELSDSVPVNLLRRSRIFIHERPAGLRANLSESLQSIPSTTLSTGPVELSRILLQVSWLHAFIIERLRYVPIGFSQPYEFTDADLQVAFMCAQEWCISASRGRQNLDPALIPYDAIKLLLKQAIYGGRIDQEEDQVILNDAVDKFVAPSCFDTTYTFVDGEILNPEGSRVENFRQWAATLPEKQPVSWLSLPASAETTVAKLEGSASLKLMEEMNEFDV